MTYTVSSGTLNSSIPLKPGLVIGTDTYWSATYDFILTFHSNRGPVSYCFRDKRRFPSKIANFSHPIYFAPPLKEFPLELVTGAGSQKTRMMGPRKKCDDIFSRLDTIHQGDRQTDTGRQQRPRLRIASRGKINSYSISLWRWKHWSVRQIKPA